MTKAAALGGTLQVALQLDNWVDPLVVASPAAARDDEMRMWSMSKPLVLVGELVVLGWGDKPGQVPTPELQDAIEGAILRSENCRQRRVVLDLQEQMGGIEEARNVVEAVLEAAGARGKVSTQSARPEDLCVPFLQEQRELADPLARGLLLGTSIWAASDAVRFMSALSRGVYGRALSKYVLRLMSEPKRQSREVSAGELTADLDWGAGRALAGRNPAYKAGWGGAQQAAFVAAQMVSFELRDGTRAGVAIAFHPDAQPMRDDPALTAAPAAIELVLNTLKRHLP